ncbi:MAG: alternative ribosome rescue aminoacyl-tRNA hydrolase ArfB [Planctomycetota bacterium]|nr:alternative ribosome rescue aminoacyl-tRNA hydrolase ArfB [Planctomycetota bacterium]
MDLRFRFIRSGGPGGQSVNKLSSQAELRVALDHITGLDDASRTRLKRLAKRWLTKLDELVIHADTHRSQKMNKQACLDRLQDIMLRATTRPKLRRKKKPTRSMIERRLENKRKVSEKKQRRQKHEGD